MRRVYGGSVRHRRFVFDRNTGRRWNHGNSKSSSITHLWRYDTITDLALSLPDLQSKTSLTTNVRLRTDR